MFMKLRTCATKFMHICVNVHSVWEVRACMCECALCMYVKIIMYECNEVHAYMCECAFQVGVIFIVCAQ